MRLFRRSASGNVLLLLCAMYFITYVDRVNIATAATAVRNEFAISNTQLGLALGAFARTHIDPLGRQGFDLDDRTD